MTIELCSVELYDMEVREIAHHEDWVIINQTYWYKGMTEQEAVQKYKQQKHIAE